MKSRSKPFALFALTAGALLLARGDATASRPPISDEGAACGTIVRDLVHTQVSQQMAIYAQRRVELETERMYDDDTSGDSFLRSSGRASTRSLAPAPTSAPSADPAPRPMESAKADKPMSRKRARRPARPSTKTASRSGAGKAGEAAGPRHVSKTNTQELSVDEGDIVKTDGRHIYHVSSNRPHVGGAVRNEIRIYKSWPISETKLIGRFTIPPRVGHTGIDQIYLHDGAMALLMKSAVSYGARGPQEGSRLDRSKHVLNQSAVSRVLVVDVRVPSSPRLTRTLDVDGSFVDARMIGSRLYLATTSAGLMLPSGLVSDIAQSARAADGQTVDQVVDSIGERWGGFASVDIGLPRTREIDVGAPSQPIYECSDLQYDTKNPVKTLLNLAHIDLGTRSRVTGAGMNGYGHNSKVYASEASFYVANPANPTHPRWSSMTTIRKFDLGRGGKPRFAATGDVRGYLLNQFAMSEYQGRLRVATSDNWRSNNVYVLETQGNRLSTVGKIENLARNERIYAVRMMGAKGYVVTFRRTDPLYTLDLSNPNLPRVVGELHVNGFSNYLHPIDEDHLLAVGQDADARGRQLGFHLQIFDVSDPSRPRRTHHERLGGNSISSTQTDHHAFMFEPNTKTLAIPWKGRNYWGLLAYRVDAKRGFKKLGRVNHAVMYKQFFRRQCRGSEATECGKRNYWWRFFTAHDLDVDRIVAIDGNLFSVSRSGLMVHRAGNRLRQRKAVLVSEPAWRPTRTGLAYGR